MRKLILSMMTFVYSRTLAAAKWGPATVVREIDPEEIARQKRKPGRDLVLFAGSADTADLTWCQRCRVSAGTASHLSLRPSANRTGMFASSLGSTLSRQATFTV
jgi:hypothetical protein